MAMKIARALQRKLRQEGIEVRKAPTDFRPVSVFRLAVQALMAAKGDVLSFVQVGANDGSFVDPLRSFVLARKWKGILVEPQPYVFEQLKLNYAGCEDRLTFENIAISRDESLTLYLPPADFKANDDGVMARSLVSSNPALVARNVGVPESELVKLDVPSMTLETLMEKHGIKELDLLQIDTEGLDWIILQTLDLTKVAPTLIQIETGHLDRFVIRDLANHLNAHGYDFYYGGHQGDGLAIRSEFIITE